MAILKKTFAVVFLCFWTLAAVAQWAPKMREHAENYEDYSEPQSLMVRALLNYPNLKLKEVPFVKENTLDSSRLKSKKLPILLGWQKEPDGRVKRAPLMVLMSGLHSTHIGDLALLKFFHNRGFHVLSLPTAWSTLYQKLGPDFTMGDFQNEALLAYEALQIFVANLKAQSLVSQTSFIGQSYGALVGLYLAKLDQGSELLFDGTITFIGPEENLEFAMTKFDTYFQEQASFVTKLRNKLKLLGTARRYQKAASYADLKEEDLALAPAMIAYGAHSKLKEVVEESIPEFRKTPYRKGEKSYEFGFKKYVEMYAPHLMDHYQGPGASFSTILQDVRSKRPGLIRVLTTDNDILNQPDSWDTTSEELIILKGGSHFGFINTEWYRTFIDLAFSKEDFRFQNFFPTFDFSQSN